MEIVLKILPDVDVNGLKHLLRDNTSLTVESPLIPSEDVPDIIKIKSITKHSLSITYVEEDPNFTISSIKDWLKFCDKILIALSSSDISVTEPDYIIVLMRRILSEKSQPINNKTMEVFIQKTIRPKVKIHDSSVEYAHENANGVDITKEIIINETRAEQLERTITLCALVEGEMVYIGLAVPNPDYDEFDPDDGKDRARGKAIKTPLVSFKVNDLGANPNSESYKKVKPDFELSDTLLRTGLKAIMRRMSRDIERNFGKYVAAYAE